MPLSVEKINNLLHIDFTLGDDFATFLWPNSGKSKDIE